MPEPNEIRAALYKTLSSGEVARSIGSAGLRHLHAVFEEEFGALEASRSFWRSVDKAALNSPLDHLGYFKSTPWPNTVPESNQSNIVLDGGASRDLMHAAYQPPALQGQGIRGVHDRILRLGRHRWKDRASGTRNGHPVCLVANSSVDAGRLLLR
jgi:hypothetical protein